MSITYIQYHDENIRDIEASIFHEKAIRFNYQSKLKKAVVASNDKQKVVKLEKGKQMIYDATKEDRRTMGYAPKENRSVPTNFLRKKEGVKFQKISDHKCYRRYVPSVPRLGVRKKAMEKKTEKESYEPVEEQPKPKRNFIKKNIDKVKGLKAAVRQPRYVDKEDGRPRLLLPSGLVPVHSCTPSFGKKPCYLDANRKSVQKIAVEFKNRQEDEIQYCKNLVRHGAREIPREELLELKRGLQKNWDYTMQTYRRFSLHALTEGMRLRKRELENTLSTIETYMSMIENNTALFVSDQY